MIDIPSNLTEGASVYLGNKQFVYNDGKLVPYVVTNVGTELTSPKLNVETLTEYRHPVTGKPIYSKTFSVGPLPINTIKLIDIDLSTAEDFWIDQTNSYANRPDNNISIPINNPIFINNVGLDKSRIFIGTIRTDANIYTKAYVCVLYTKTTDTSSSPVKSLYTGSLNEVRQNVETHAGYKRNGKDVYQIEVDFGFLPNATTKSVVVPILEPTYTCWIDNSKSYVYASDLYNEYYSINMPGPTNITYQIGCWVIPKTKSVNVVTGINRSNQTAKIVIQYTK